MKDKNSKYQFKKHFATTFKHLTPKNMVPIYMSIFSVYLTVLAPTIVDQLY